MAHQVQKMAYVGEIPWHGLGNELTEDAPLHVWEREAGFQWDAIPEPMYVTLNGEQKRVPGRRALVRSDNKEVLSVVSKGYKVVNPRDILDTFNTLLLKTGLFRMETAGCLRGGRKVWCLAKAVDDAVLDFGGDKITRYALLATSYDKSIKTIFQQTSVRVVCNNDAPGQAMDTTRGTLWGALNAVTFHVDHVAKARTQDARLDKAWFGHGAVVKDRAMELAAALCN